MLKRTVLGRADGTAQSWGHTSIAEMHFDLITQESHCFSCGSVKSRELIVTGEDQKTTTYDLPKDDFFLSIAPYIEHTHPCATHSLTGCQGELADEEFSVTIDDSEGNTVMDTTLMKSQSNGFIDLWLPRDQTYRVTVEHEGRQSEAELSTFESDDTCVTTMQLS
ncbi:CueP family metal-binding protein [Paenibacillus donghaensis]|uniref:CueP family metal-binding protein n=1 Tax=Paenibacillus donghaensis TaxID=414771 RepID=UPI001B800F9E